MIDVGLIGFGLAGKCFHAPVIRAVSGLRLAAIMQRSGDEAARTYPNAQIVRSVEELLAIETIRLVSIATRAATLWSTSRLPPALPKRLNSFTSQPKNSAS